MRRLATAAVSSGIGHFGVAAATAAQGHLPIVSHFGELDAGDGLDDLARCIIDAAGPAQVTGVVIGDRLRETAQFDPALSNQLSQ